MSKRRIWVEKANMTAALVCYLERNLFTGELMEASSPALTEQYVLGHLYLIRHRLTSLPSWLSIKVGLGERIYFDSLHRVGVTNYELRYDQSGIRSRQFPAYSLGKPIRLRGDLLANRLVEANPEFLDRLEREFDYNVLGQSDLTSLIDDAVNG